MKLFRHAKHEEGFTLIEMLVVAPIVILTIGAFLTVIINMTGDVLASRASNTLSYNVQDALNRIETDVKASSNFAAVTNASDMGTNQGFNNDGTVFKSSTGSTGQELILNMVATTTNPVSSTSSYVYLKNKPNACSAPQQNTPFTYKVVYFIKQDGSDNVLYRRTLMPSNYSDTTNTVCALPYQQPSCAASLVDAGTTPTSCKTKDVELVRSDQSLQFFVQYFNGESATGENVAATASDDGNRGIALQSATTVGVSIDAQKTAAGRTVERSAIMRVSRNDGNAAGVNTTVVTDAAPSAPNVVASVTEPTYATFTWNKVSQATGYTIQYQINGGAVTTGFVNQNQTTFTVTSSTHNDVVTAQVTAINSVGSSAVTYASVTAPLWVSPALQNNWSNYNSVYTRAGYTKTPDGYVLLQGLITSSTTPGTNELIETLPVGYRPAATMTFQAESNGDGASIIVQTDGSVLASTNTSAAWVSLADVKFLSATSPHSWTNLSMVNGWTNRGAAGDPALSYTTDAIGRFFVRGAIAGGTTTDATIITTLPTSATTAKYSHIAVRSGGSGSNAVGITNTSHNMVAKGVAVGTAYFPNISFFPDTYTGSTWNSVGAAGQPAFLNSWVNYGSSYNTAQFTKSSDNIVTIRGLVKSGTTNANIFTLPSGYRPSARIITAAWCNAAQCRVDIDVNGNVVATSTGTSAVYTSLDRISFYADGS